MQIVHGTSLMDRRLVWGWALYITREEMEIRNQEEIKEQKELDRQLLDLGPTVPLPEVPQPVPSPSTGGVLNWENSAKEGAR